MPLWQATCPTCPTWTLGLAGAPGTVRQCPVVAPRRGNHRQQLPPVTQPSSLAVDTMSSDLDAGSDPELVRSSDAMADTEQEENAAASELSGAVETESPNDDDEEIPEATPLLLHPSQSSSSEIANDESSDLLPDTDVEVDAFEGDDPIVFDRDVDVKICGSEETHDLRALASTRSKMSDRNKRQPNFCSVDVVGPDGVKKRFAPGTKAAFAVERFNCQLKDPAMPVVCIAACKDGEDPIEFGPDVELVSYDDSWTLKTLREAVQYISGKPVNEDPVQKLKDTIKEGTARAFSSLKPVTKVPGAIFGPGSTNTKHNESIKPTGKSIEDVDALQYFGVKSWEDLYPDGKLPEGGAQDCSPSYIGKVILTFVFVFAFAGGLSYILERMPDPTRPFY